ncbi:MAG: hypothetical protein Q8R83_08865, partial [Legionellaceae bacterium]|nr:hypothetical protein [Legionellaceae bacterium]
HVFQGRYKSILVEKESYLLELSRYIVLNPVRAKMVEKAGDWFWSSYLLSLELIFVQFSTKSLIALKKYQDFVEEGLISFPLDTLKKTDFSWFGRFYK